MDAREQRGIVIAAMCRIDRKDGRWIVPSQSNPDKSYAVNLAENKCTCPDCEAGFLCKHIRAVKITLKRELGMNGEVTETRSVTFEEKKVYTQNWPAYNKAQSEEKHRFQRLLFELCEGIPSKPRGGRGRPSILVADAAFAVCYKTYSTFSARRFNCDLQDAHGKGYLTQPIHFSSVNACLEKKELTPVLHSLVVQSSLPLRSVERQFAVDASGFATNRFSRWYDEKYGVNRKKADWVKCHLLCGTKTHIVAAVKIGDKNDNDSPFLPELVKTTAQNFDMAEVSADKGYLSVENVEAICRAGARPFIAFKSNSTGASGGLFARMFHYYQYHREMYMDHYHRRSNVESVFSMVKAKFRDHVRSKTDTAMTNEVLTKLVAHNLCCLIQSQIELGIEAEFWGGEAAKITSSNGKLVS